MVLMAERNGLIKQANDQRVENMNANHARCNVALLQKLVSIFNKAGRAAARAEHRTCIEGYSNSRNAEYKMKKEELTKQYENKLSERYHNVYHLDKIKPKWSRSVSDAVADTLGLPRLPYGYHDSMAD